MIVLKSFSFYLAIIGILLLIVFSHIKGRPTPDSTYVQKPASSPFSIYLAASGIVESIDKNIEIGAPEEGIIEQLWVAVGDKVQKDQPLFRIDTRDLTAQLIVRKANYEVAKITLEKQINLLKRVQVETDLQTVSREEYQTREDEVKMARAKLNAAAAEIAQTERLIDRLTVRASKSGTILQVNVRVGENVTRNQISIILGNIEHLQMRVSIDEQNAGRFNQENKAVAFPKNNTAIEIPLEFVRVEPYVIPKKSLTGVSEERVDTRVLEVIYSFNQPKKYHMYVGQQTDVFIEIKNDYLKE